MLNRSPARVFCVDSGRLQETMRGYIQQHPELNMTQEDYVKSILTKAERHLKDKSDGRPDKPPP